MNLWRISRLDAIRAGIAGTRAVAVRAAAKTLFDAGGQRVLPVVVQQAVRGAIERQASRMLATVGIMERALEGRAAQAVAVRGVRVAGRQIVRGVGTAAAAGALVDGAWALVQALKRIRAGSMTRKQAAAHVAREAGTGAAATAAGTAAAALLVAVTGGVATPAVFVVAAAASIGAKMGLDAWIGHARSGANARPTLLLQGSVGS